MFGAKRRRGIEKLATRMNTGNIIRVYANLMTFRGYTQLKLLFCTMTNKFNVFGSVHLCTIQ